MSTPPPSCSQAAGSARVTNESARQADDAETRARGGRDRWRCDAICQLLVEAGYTIAHASNGFTGLRLAECDHPNVIVLGPTLSELGVASLLSALQANRSTRGIPVLLVDRRAGGMTSGLGRLSSATAVCRDVQDTVDRPNESGSCCTDRPAVAVIATACSHDSSAPRVKRRLLRHIQGDVDASCHW